MKNNPVYGWVVEGNNIIPVFYAEKELYKGKKIHKTIEAAKEARK